ncbi:NifU family protein [Buchnera aphidicola]|uniref:NifU family protein n=1 Tax=Buchnera aphidicola TaxID=9 RepID=UPI0020922D80|nr:NifU family protein [Buchnera aphidicola]USS94098.1 NifU family protein [Buchnera aphidicola (Sipha maydis)]WII23644.1 NifU family protein [Buchnera aphidicola (Sipha maydis)]
MIKISKNAQEYISRLLYKKKNIHVRIFIKNFGKEDASCHMEYVHIDDVLTQEKEIKFSNFNIYINKRDLPYLKKSEIKLVKSDLNFELMLNAPDLKKTFQKNDYSLQEEINSFIELHINPFLFSHGGKVVLIEVNKKNQAMIEFQGGCNGCSMVSTTLKDMVEKRLLNNFKKLTKVIDVTKHIHDIHSYY